VDIKQKFLLDLLEDINARKLVLPSLPDLAIKVRQIVEDPTSNAAKVAKIVGTDAALSARLLQVANSVYYRGHAAVEDLQAAVARLGSNVVRNLVTGFVLRQLYQSKSSAQTKRRLQALHEHNVRVAAYSQVLARKFTSLKPDVAMLGGIIHRIGVLPILIRADTCPELMDDQEALDDVIDKLHPIVGKAMLESWNFPTILISVVVEHGDLQRDSGPQADYADIVTVALLHSHLDKDHPLQWDEVPAFRKLGLNAKQHIEAMKEARDELLEVQKLLG
jgi:HD-like signal output (HDOD) protein